MPLLVPLAAAWITGLFVGTAALPGWWTRSGMDAIASLAGAICAALAMATPRGAATRPGPAGMALRWAVVCAVLWAGGVVGRAHRHRQARCVQALVSLTEAGVPLAVRLEADPLPARAIPGTVTVVEHGATPQRPRGATCAVVVQLLLPARQPVAARAGATLLVRAVVRRQGDRLRLEGQGTVAVSPQRPDRLRQWRGAVGRLLDRQFGAHAPMARALLVADQREIPAQVRDRFADAGLVHLLSVSGTHVAIIAGALATMGTALRLGPGVVTSGSLVIVVAYVLLLGAPPPAVRSATMLAVDALTRRLQRPVHPWTSLALGAVVPTVDPAVVTNLGWQLSVAGMAALVVARGMFRLRPVALRRRSRPGWGAQLQRRLARLRGTMRLVVLEGATGVLAGVVTAPLIAWHFGRISLIAPLANLVAAPVVAVLQPALFLTLLVAPMPAVVSWVAGACRALLAVFDEVARVAAAVPGAAVPVAPSGVEAAACGVAILCAMVATAVPRPSRWWRAAGGAILLAAAAPLLPLGSGQLEAHILDVGQGDAIALRTPRGRWVLLDAGRRWDGGDAGRRTVIPYLRRWGGEVALFILTHAHEDHVGGAATVVEALRPRGWWEPAFVTPSPAYAQALAALDRAGIPWERATPGRRLRMDGVTITVLAPDSTWTARQQDANETSVVVRVDYGERRFLFTGDAEAAEEAWLVAEGRCASLRADILKLGHHGSRTSTSAPFLAAVSPRVAVASVGAGNRYGHPSLEVVERLAASGIPLWRTDLDGTVVIRTDGHALTVEGADGRWRWRPDPDQRSSDPPEPVCSR